jgi:hypothetical protein
VLLLVLSAVPAGAVPPLMNYQGYLTDTGGAPSTGALPMTFALFANSTGGSAMWTETYVSVTVRAGVFGVLLGEATPLPWGALLTGNMLWLETTVNGIALQPRRPIVSVPYAFRAGVADSAISAGTTIRTLSRWSGQFPDGTDNGPLSGRSMTLIKKYSDTGVRVGWTDNFRVGLASTACQWEILFNGAPCASPITFAMYETSSSYSHDPVGVFGTCFGLPAGPVFITTRVGPPPGFPPSDCYTGWQGVTSMEAEEVR